RTSRLTPAVRLSLYYFVHPLKPSPPRTRIRQQAEAVPPVPQHARIIANQKRAGQLRVTQSQQFTHGRAQEQRADALARIERTDENPRQMRPAEATRESVRRRWFLPVIRIPAAWVGVRQQRHQNAADRRCGVSLHGDKTGLLDPRTITTGARMFQTLARRRDAALIVETAKRLLAIERGGEQRRQLFPVRWPHRTQGRLAADALQRPTGQRFQIEQGVVIARPRIQPGALLEILVLVGRVARQLMELLERNRQLQTRHPLVTHIRFPLSAFRSP